MKHTAIKRPQTDNLPSVAPIIGAGEKLLSRLKASLAKNAVMWIALAAALVTSVFVPPDGKYLGYFDYKTLSCLFCVLAVVGALRDEHFFDMAARKTVSLFKNTRASILAIVYITFIGSMLIANDMALLTFLPLGYIVLTCAGRKEYMAFTFIMQNIAANLGGMLTPFGNPQNLYLYTKFNIPIGEFMLTMLLPFAVSITLITVCCLFIKKEPLTVPYEKFTSSKPKTALYLLLFLLSIVIVFRVIPYYIGLAVIIITLAFTDRHALYTVDYPLLLTFVFFFVFAGNMARITVVREFFAYLLEQNTLLVSVLSCQMISNVPSAILLSEFTANYRELLIGVNIGGVGTLISSLASLITFREYTKHNPGRTKFYILIFSAFNFAFLILLTVIMLFVM